MDIGDKLKMNPDSVKQPMKLSWREKTYKLSISGGGRMKILIIEDKILWFKWWRIFKPGYL